MSRLADFRESMEGRVGRVFFLFLFSATVRRGGERDREWGVNYSELMARRDIKIITNQHPQYPLFFYPNGEKKREGWQKGEPEDANSRALLGIEKTEGREGEGRKGKRQEIMSKKKKMRGGADKPWS